MLDKKSKRNHTGIMETPTKNNPHGKLAALWRHVIEHDTHLPHLEKYYDFYANSPSRFGTKKKTKSAVREMATSDEISFKSLVFLLGEVLNVSELKLSAEVKYESGKTTVHTVNIISSEEDKK